METPEDAIAVDLWRLRASIISALDAYHHLEGHSVLFDSLVLDDAGLRLRWRMLRPDTTHAQVTTRWSMCLADAPSEVA